jgi:hypothetical protein
MKNITYAQEDDAPHMPDSQFPPLPSVDGFPIQGLDLEQQGMEKPWTVSR